MKTYQVFDTLDPTLHIGEVKADTDGEALEVAKFAWPDQYSPILQDPSWEKMMELMIDRPTLH